MPDLVFLRSHLKNRIWVSGLCQDNAERMLALAPDVKTVIPGLSRGVFSIDFDGEEKTPDEMINTLRWVV